MRKISESKVGKILILASVLVLMLTLCGCRTRITNNDEVSNVMYDEEGWMKDEYDMRREDLGLDKAPKPIFTGFGTPDDEEYDGSEYGDDEDFMEDYDPEYDEYSDVDEPEPGSTTNEGDGARKRGTQSTVIRRGPTNTTPKKDDTKVQVLLDAGTNGGTISKKKTITVTVEKGGTYSSLPDPDKRKGYTFKGWYTKKEDGTKVTKETKVTVTQKHKLYAQWEKKKKKTEPKPEKEPEKKPEPEKKSYEITFDVNSPDDAEASSVDEKITVTEDGTYPTLPTPKCDGYEFKGWYSGDTEIKSGASVKIKDNQLLTAKWEKKPQEYWDKKLADTVDSLNEEDKPSYWISGEDGEKFLDKSGMKKGSKDDCEYIVVFGSREEAEAIDNPEEKPILVIPKDAIKSSVKDAVKTVYRIKVLNNFFTTELDADRAADELGLDSEDIEDIEEI